MSLDIQTTMIAACFAKSPLIANLLGFDELGQQLFFVSFIFCFKSLVQSPEILICLSYHKGMFCTGGLSYVGYSVLLIEIEKIEKRENR